MILIIMLYLRVYYSFGVSLLHLSYFAETIVLLPATKEEAHHFDNNLSDNTSKLAFTP